MQIENLDTQFDSNFNQLGQLKWFPWVGDLYASSSEGSRLFFLGESCYDWGSSSAPERLKQNTFTREMVGKSHGINPKSKEKFFRNMERAFYLKGKVSIDARVKLWRSVCFHNLVLRPMASVKQRPSLVDYIDGWKVFFTLAEITKPNVCIFAGTDWKKLHSFKEVARESDNVVMPQTWRKKVGRSRGSHLIVTTRRGHSFSVVFIKHPSMSFSWKMWGTFVREQLNQIESSPDILVSPAFPDQASAYMP
ncbi:hypothetical protein GEOBRER4_n1604 [Citrifermentans bremense]|uniref:Uncharacterized protein n=1 Tax=Citrifermentans bremense TaxID=60035 RepID=A0A7R7IZ72_9BACT|nr:hypothetical protein [Citrifermentans bremense]BCO11321.1 hypothetical protein GEOBRER4_n1604 [Citrifermentans bremense]